MRLGVLLLVGALAATASPALAATKPVCHLIPDDRGDEGPVTPIPVPVPAVAADDLLSADVASDGRTLTVVVRVADLPTTDQAAPLGRQYQVSFAVAPSTTRWFVRARTSPVGTSFVFGKVGTAAPLVTQSEVLGTGRGAIDRARREVRVHVPLSAFRARRGSHLVDVSASVSRVYGHDLTPQPVVGGVVVPTSSALAFDVAQGRPYVVGTASCVRVGR